MQKIQGKVHQPQIHPYTYFYLSPKYFKSQERTTILVQSQFWNDSTRVELNKKPSLQNGIWGTNDMEILPTTDIFLRISKVIFVIDIILHSLWLKIKRVGDVICVSLGSDACWRSGLTFLI